MQEIKICKRHECEIIDFNFNSQNQEDKYLCAKCLIENYLESNCVYYIQDIGKMILEFKSRQNLEQNNIFEIQQKLLMSLNEYVQSYLGVINQKVQKILKKIKEKATAVEHELANLGNKSNDSIIIEEILDSSKSLKVLENKFSLTEVEELYKSVYDQLQELQQSNEIFEIMKKISNNIPKIETLQTESYVFAAKPKLESKRTLSLPFACNKHNKEIIMMTQAKDKDNQRLLCIECLSDCQSMLLNLKDADLLWRSHQEKVYDQKFKFFSSRENVVSKVIDIIEKYQKQQKQYQNDIQKLIQGQKQKINEDIKLLQKPKSLFQLNLQDIHLGMNLISKDEVKKQEQDIQINSGMMMKYSQLKSVASSL